MDLDVILNEFDEIIYVANIHTYELLYMNEKCQQLTGCSDSSYIGKKCYKTLQNLDEPCPFCNNHLLSHDKIFQWEYTNAHLQQCFYIKDKLIDWEGSPARIEFAMDITEYKAKLSKAETKMTSIIKSIPGGICMLGGTEELSILWHNEHFLEILGYTKAQFDATHQGKATYIFPDDVPAMKALMDAVKDTGTSASLTMRAVRRDGSIRIMLTSVSFYETYDNGMPVFYSICVDITDYKHKEEQDKQALQDALASAREANVAKGRFLSRMSHEIRTPLNAVIGMTNIAGAALNNKEALRDCHKKIDSAAKYLLSLVNDILDVSRIESGKLQLAHQPFSLPDFLSGITSLFSMQAQKAHITFEVSLDGFDEEYFLGDQLHLKQIIVNLLSNALKFTEPGGKVALHFKALSREGNILWLEINVQDTGIGITKEAQARVFETFEQENSDTTSRYGGSGLGLSISKHIVGLMGGNISVQSTAGKGSTFTVAIPLEINEQCPNIKEQTHLHALQQHRILVVGTLSDGKKSQHILKKMSLQADTALSGQEALSKIRESLSSSKAYDVVITNDYVNDMSGLQLVERIDALHSPSPIKYIMSSYNINILEPAKNSSCSVFYMQKPLFYSVLLHVLCQVFGYESFPTEQRGTTISFKNKRVLLAEDNEINMEIACELLKAREFEVDTATDGKQALDSFCKHAPGYYDVILMDIRMPIMDGLTATREIRALQRKDAQRIPIIALSANAFEEDRQRSKDSGMDGHIAKPIEIDELYQELAKVMF